MHLAGRAVAPFRGKRHGQVRRLHMMFGSANIPHPEKATTGGEDAFFADDATGAFGVADGVGGSKTLRADPGLFSRELLRHCRRALAAKPHDLPAAALVAGAGFARNPMGGSSTLFLGQLEPPAKTSDGDGILRLLNLGDSGGIIFRPSPRKFQKGTFLWPRIVMRSHDATHFFNCPYQLAADDDFEEQMVGSDTLQTTARSGDIVVAATDGVLDNIFESKIQMHVAHLVIELLNPNPQVCQDAVDRLAKNIAQEAHEIGLREDEENLQTPFMVSAGHEGYHFAGGKLDDVTVVCGVVRSGNHTSRVARMLNNLDKKNE
jgi:protein phosphatase PTC7